MSVAAPKNTLLYQRKGRPLTLKRDISLAPITGVASKVREFGNKYGPHITPESEAINFYLANHAMKELEFRFDPEEPLPDWAVSICDKYHEIAARIAARAFYYMLLITAREARHNQSKSSMKDKIAKQFGEPAAMGLLHYPDANSIDSVTQVFDTQAKGATLGDVCRSIVYTFYKGKFSSSYGGPKWGNVADCMTNYATGEYTAEMMLDTVWTLVHNGGPIFNKGMLYSCHSHALQMVLDIQRAGMIPSLVLAPYGNPMAAAEAHVGGWAKIFAQEVSEALGGKGDFDPQKKVDYAGLNKLGAIGNYTSLAKSLMGKGAAKPAPGGVGGFLDEVNFMAQPIFKKTEKTHYIIAQAHGLMFKKLTRAELKEGV